MKEKSLDQTKNLKPSSSMPLIFNTNKSKKNNILFKDYNKFIKHIENSMKQYKVNIPISFNNKEENNNNILSSKKYITKQELNYINKITHLNNSHSLSHINESHLLKEKNLFKISVNHNPNYLNPIHSLGIIKLNNKIYDDIIQTNIKRQKIKFDESIKNIEEYRNKFKVKMPKIKVTTINSKIEENIKIIDKTKKKETTRKKLIMLFSNLLKTKTIKFFSYYKYPNINFPECREQFTLNINENFVYLTGGMCSVMKELNIWKLNLKTLIWTKLQLNNNTSNRFGHTCIIEKNKLYIFGGRTKIIPSNNNKNYVSTNSGIYCGLDVYNLNNNYFTSPYFANKSSPRLRRNHICELIGNYMVIHGGITENNEILNDTYLLNIHLINYHGRDNLDNYYEGVHYEKWTKLILSPYSLSPFLYGHSACLVIPKEIKNSKFSIYKFSDISFGFNKKDNNNKNNKENYIKGWYIFGGKGKTEISNDLYILKLGIKPCEWIKLDNINGKRPCPRYFHTMNYFEKKNIIIIHGGRNDNKSESFALNDTYLFNLESLTWMEIELYSNNIEFKIFSRCAHCSFIYRNKLIICGGMNNNNYLGSSLFIINLDENYKPKIENHKEIMSDYSNEKKNDSEDNFSDDDQDKNETLNKEIDNLNQIGMIFDINLPNIK